MDDLTEEDLPLSTRRQRKSYQPKKKICSNCCQTCYGPRKKSQNPNQNPNTCTENDNNNYNYKEDDEELYEMLAVIYKLNYISSDVEQDQGNNNFIINKSSLTLCSSCTRLLYKFYPLFSQFNQLRQLDSQLARGIKAVDKILISHKFNQSDNNCNRNPGTRELKHDGFSPADGPWVKIGRRLEEMEFQEIGYKPHRHSRVRKQTKVDKQQQNQITEGQYCAIFDDPVDISDGDHGIEKYTDVKLFNEPVSDSIDGNLLLQNEMNESSLPENKYKSKTKPKKLSIKKIKTKVESDYDDEQQQDEDNDDYDYTPKSKSSRGRPRKSKEMKQNKERTRPKKERPKKYQNRAPRPVKTDNRNERRRQRYHKKRDLLISGYKAPPEQEEDLKCVVVGCGLGFKKASDLKLHERQNHVKDGPYLCNLPLNYGAGPPCTSTFPILFLLKRHQQTSKHVIPDESLKVTCQECGKILQNKLVYNIHFYRRHTEQGRKVYDEDQKRIADKQKKQRAEERQLLLQKGFFCDICQVDFQTKIKLTTHKISAHEDYGKRYKPYVCEVCGKKCVGLYRLNQHVTIVHSEERPVICALCGRRYKTEGHLRGHMKTGHDEEGRRKYNQYMRESNRRRKELAEALARKALEDQQGESQTQESQEEAQQQTVSLPLQLLPTTTTEHHHHHQQQISIGESLLLNLTNPMMDFTFTTTTVQNP